jgi:methylmalonyl-CoA mutase N-terminal domain/subunit
MMLRFHTQTAGSSLTAQQPDVNIVRTALQALSGVLGGTQSLHTNSRDEALSLPTEESARIALRTQQIIAHETGVTNTVDPVGGSEYIEALTDRIETEALDYIHRIDAMGGAVAAIENGFIRSEIQNAAFAYQRKVESGEQIVVGVNRFQMGTGESERASIAIFRLDPLIERTQLGHLGEVRASRDNSAVEDRLNRLRETARGSQNLMPAILDAAEHYATVGEISDAMRSIFGEYIDGT